jgi:hypothetical protein
MVSSWFDRLTASDFFALVLSVSKDELGRSQH